MVNVRLKDGELNNSGLKRQREMNSNPKGKLHLDGLKGVKSGFSREFTQKELVSRAGFDPATS
ncbi:MAG: hypothetical protein GF308_11750 [Candidatus Heimdallarchaeota archaeon]|nr:hypothetical protein [Candidatus Heimdallarchaeota archaeon]